nr:hypothetical protein [Thermoactinospora rubra]
MELLPQHGEVTVAPLFGKRRVHREQQLSISRIAQPVAVFHIPVDAACPAAAAEPPEDVGQASQEAVVLEQHNGSVLHFDVHRQLRAVEESFQRRGLVQIYLPASPYERQFVNAQAADRLPGALPQGCP